MCQENRAPLSGSLPKENKRSPAPGADGEGAGAGEREKVAELRGGGPQARRSNDTPLAPPYDPILISGSRLPFALS